MTSVGMAECLYLYRHVCIYAQPHTWFLEKNVFVVLKKVMGFA